MALLYKLENCTRELVSLTREIVELTRKFEEDGRKDKFRKFIVWRIGIQW